MLLSRAADGLYWISRYLERAEHTARLVDVARDLGLDRAAIGQDAIGEKSDAQGRDERGEQAAPEPAEDLVHDAGA